MTCPNCKTKMDLVEHYVKDGVTVRKFRCPECGFIEVKKT